MRQILGLVLALFLALSLLGSVSAAADTGGFVSLKATGYVNPDFVAERDAALVAWIRDFSDTYTAATGRAPVIYTPTGWWNQCTDGNTGFGANPLWATGTGPLPPGWTTHTFRQTPHGDVFNGTREELLAFAAGA